MVVSRTDEGESPPFRRRRRPSNWAEIVAVGSISFVVSLGFYLLAWSIGSLAGCWLNLTLPLTPAVVMFRFSFSEQRSWQHFVCSLVSACATLLGGLPLNLVGAEVNALPLRLVLGLALWFMAMAGSFAGRSISSQRFTITYHPPGTCPACGYCLTGLKKTVCPECGRRFRPEEVGPDK